MRVTQRWQVESSLYHLRKNQEAVDKLQVQIATGQRVQKPDDDPQSAQQAVRLRSYLEVISGSLETINLSEDWMNATAAGLQELNDTLTKARLEGLRAANDTISPEIRQSIAAGVKELFSHAVSVANTEHRGQFVFAGYKVTASPFVADMTNLTVTYNGDGGTIEHEVEPGSKMPVNTAGSHPLFNQTFTALKSLYDSLMSGDSTDIRDSIGELDAGIDQCLEQESTVGIRLKVLDGTRSRLEQFEVDLRGLLSKAEDVDMPEAILKLQSNQQGYQATLSAFGQSMPNSLFDYLR